LAAATTLLVSGCGVSAASGGDGPDAGLTAQLAEMPVVSLRGPEDNPTLDPDVLAEFWDSAQVRAATPVEAAPVGGAAGPAAPAPGASAPRPEQAPFVSALLVRSPTGPFSDPVVVAPAAPAAVGEVVTAPVLDSPAEGDVLAARVTGRLFFTVGGGQPRSCTATVVASGSGSVIATAGHCLLTDGADGERETSTNLLFAPGYVDGTFPFGRWSVESVHLAQGWTQGAVWGQDVAFLRVARSAETGETLQNEVGALGIAFDPAAALAGTTTALLGYPSVAPFDGSVLRWCATGNPAAPAAVDPAGVGMSCEMTAGYSGGPLVSQFDPATGTGFVAGVGSHDYGAGTVYAPRLGDDALAAYSLADQ
jgi:hypothetical protein